MIIVEHDDRQAGLPSIMIIANHDPPAESPG